MNKIEMNTVLPKAPEPVQKARSGNLFQEQLGLGNSNTGQGRAEELLQDPLQKEAWPDGNAQHKSLHHQEVELYGLTALAQHHLSYLRDRPETQPARAVPMPSAVAVNAAERVMQEMQASPSLASTAVTTPAAALVFVEAPVAAATENELALGQGAAAAVPEILTAKHPRRVSLMRTTGGFEAVVRDYAGDAAELLAQIHSHCHDNGISLTRIVLNGTVLWSKPEAP